MDQINGTEENEFLQKPSTSCDVICLPDLGNEESGGISGILLTSFIGYQISVLMLLQ